MNTEYSADVAVDKWMVQDLYRLRGGMCTSPATSWSNKLRRHVAATNRFVCTGEFCDNLSLCNRILSQQQVAQILSDLIFCDLFSSGTKFNYVADFHKNSLAHTKRFLAATCRRRFDWESDKCQSSKLYNSLNVWDDLETMVFTL